MGDVQQSLSLFYMRKGTPGRRGRPDHRKTASPDNRRALAEELPKHFSGMVGHKVPQMGVLLITCPATGKRFSRLPDYEAATWCPHCKKLHRWRPAEARWVEALPPGDWIENQ
jgi:thiol-disulfide isomerase/thioredoxin